MGTQWILSSFKEQTLLYELKTLRQETVRYWPGFYDSCARSQVRTAGEKGQHGGSLVEPGSAGLDSCAVCIPQGIRQYAWSSDQLTQHVHRTLSWGSCHMRHGDSEAESSSSWASVASVPG